MANIISNDKVDAQNCLQMSNGLTSVFIAVICLAGSDRAKESFQKDLMIWFAQRDWKLLGLGFVGFDIAEIIWEREIFEGQKSFLLETLESALHKKNWEELGYQPREDWVLNSLAVFKGMVSAFGAEHIEENGAFQIIPFEDRYKTCDRHGVFLHALGCVICNDG